jgi:hypothetical protein
MTLSCRRIGVKDSLLDQQTTYGNGVSAIDLQQMNRRAAGRRLGMKSSTIPGEMLVPLLSPRMKQRDDLTGVRIDPRQVRPFIAVAVAARESQVFQYGGAAVLLSDDVVEVKRQLSERFRETTILAAVTGPDADGFMNRFVHWRA